MLIRIVRDHGHGFPITFRRKPCPGNTVVEEVVLNRCCPVFRQFLVGNDIAEVISVPSYLNLHLWVIIEDSDKAVELCFRFRKKIGFGEFKKDII